MTTLGKYELLTLLGEGATSEVYRARDLALGREVALKVLKPSLVTDTSAFDRFAREAHAAAGLFHPNIATVLDMGEADGRYFIAMRYFNGQSLDKILKERGPLSWDETLRMVTQIGSALDHAHQQGFLHRDVKPGNIIRAENGDFILTDFGLTRAMMSTGLTSHTGAILGTPSYIAPEVWNGEPATPATDQYALACVVYEALTGSVLFDGETPQVVITRHLIKGPQFTTEWPREAPTGIKAVLEMALASNPSARYPGMVAFSKAFTAPAPAVPTPTAFETGKAETSPAKTPEAISDVPLSSPKPALSSSPTPSNAQKPVAAPNPTPVREPSKSNKSVKRPSKKGISWGWALAGLFVGGVCVIGLLVVVLSQMSAPTIQAATATRQVNAIATITNTKVSSTTVNVRPATSTSTNPRPTANIQKTSTPMPGKVTSALLQMCSNSAGDVCVYNFAPQSNGLIIALKFKQTLNTGSLPSLTVAGKTYKCEIVSTYPDRLYCNGQALSGNTELVIYTSNKQVLASGTFNIPKYIPPSPTRKKPGNTYP